VNQKPSQPTDSRRLQAAFLDGLRVAFSVCVVLSLGAAAASWLRGPRRIHDDEVGWAAPAGSGERTLGLGGSDAVGNFEQP
jgi:hypothetical protein